MRPSDELFKLIKSLTKSEKRFFKLSSSLQSGEKNYIKLFDAIENQRRYDEEAIRKAFANETFIRHLPSEKNHLYKLILKSLRAYYAGSSIDAQLHEELQNVEILVNKTLHKEAFKIIRKAKKMAQENKRFYYLYELLAWEKQIMESSDLGPKNRPVSEIEQEAEAVVAALRDPAAFSLN